MNEVVLLLFETVGDFRIINSSSDNFFPKTLCDLVGRKNKTVLSEYVYLHTSFDVKVKGGHLYVLNLMPETGCSLAFFVSGNGRMYVSDTAKQTVEWWMNINKDAIKEGSLLRSDVVSIMNIISLVTDMAVNFSGLERVREYALDAVNITVSNDIIITFALALISLKNNNYRNAVIVNSFTSSSVTCFELLIESNDESVALSLKKSMAALIDSQTVSLTCRGEFCVLKYSYFREDPSLIGLKCRKKKQIASNDVNADCKETDANK